MRGCNDQAKSYTELTPSIVEAKISDMQTEQNHATCTRHNLNSWHCRDTFLRGIKCMYDFAAVDHCAHFLMVNKEGFQCFYTHVVYLENYNVP